MLSILLVDDEHFIRAGIKKLLDWESLGFEIVGDAKNGREALAFLETTPTDIVITDLRMPFMDGMELTGNLKEKYPGIQVIVLTGYDDFELMQQGIRYGVADYLLKPVSREALDHSLGIIKNKMDARHYGYPFEIEAQLLMAQSKADSEGADRLLGQLKEYCSAHAFPLEALQRIAMSILYAGMRDLSVQGQQVDGFKDEYATYEQILDAKALEDIFAPVGTFFEAACALGTARDSDNRISKVKDYIKAHYGEDISLELLASRFYINPSYLSQLFKTDTGGNYSDYLTEIRVGRAKEMLLSGRFSVQQVSERCGFGDSKYFSQLFKKHVGVQPSRYSQQMQEPDNSDCS